MDPASRARRRRDALVLGALLLPHVWLALAASRAQSLTVDEHVYVAAGMAHLLRGDDRLNPEQPPLPKLLAGLPGLISPPTWDASDPDWVRAQAWREAYDREGLTRANWDAVTASLRAEWPFSVRFLYRLNAERFPRWRWWLPLPFVIASALTGLAIFVGARALWGSLAAAVALALWSFCPTALAHAGLATTDALFTLFHTVFLLALLRLIQAGASPARLGLLAASLLGAVLSKHSGLVLVGIGGAALAAAAAQGRDRATLRRVVLPGAGALALGLLAAPLVLAALFGRSHYLAGVEFVLTRLIADARPAYLGGALAERFPHYFVVAAGLKSTLPTLVLTAGATILALRRGAWRRWEVGGLLALLAGLFALVSLRYPNIGVRYLLPLYPLAFLLVGWAASTLARRGRIAVVALLAGHALSAGLASPSFLAYSNALTLPYGLAPWLDDSNLDWGQDLPGLARWCAEQRIQRVHLVQYGIADPEAYGVPAVPTRLADLPRVPPGAVVALSVTYLQRDPGVRELVRSWRRLVVIRGTLYVYQVPG